MGVAAEALGQDDATVGEQRRVRLGPDAVAAVASQERGQPIARTTVWSYVQKSKPGGRYAERDPHPLPRYDGDPSRPWWPLEDEERIRAWWARRRPFRRAG